MFHVKILKKHTVVKENSENKKVKQHVQFRFYIIFNYFFSEQKLFI